MNEKYTVAIDLDGVLADFNKKANEITDGQFSDVTFPKSKFWKMLYQYNNDVEPFFENLPKMEGADELVNFVTSNFKNVFILTATGSTPKNAPEQKKNWVKKHYSDLKTVTVVGSKDKAIYANPRTILIDDRMKSIDPWRKAGGIGILFKNNQQTISELENVLK